ncbi:hypothetical protein B0H17DRAFT_1201602 [Mycena rosella]|uniref:Uncharacterized protein n=1 Tax=Mycena rosella TaxID=1033263 RepID=A0AAD7GE82_MYCRO|nr:hypothetical protein B0H17DRAFT_1201602 [Mycena rosella]
MSSYDENPTGIYTPAHLKTFGAASTSAGSTAAVITNGPRAPLLITLEIASCASLPAVQQLKRNTARTQYRGRRGGHCPNYQVRPYEGDTYYGSYYRNKHGCTPSPNRHYVRRRDLRTSDRGRSRLRITEHHTSLTRGRSHSRVSERIQCSPSHDNHRHGRRDGCSSMCHPSSRSMDATARRSEERQFCDLQVERNAQLTCEFQRELDNHTCKERNEAPRALGSAAHVTVQPDQTTTDVEMTPADTQGPAGMQESTGDGSGKGKQRDPAEGPGFAPSESSNTDTINKDLEFFKALGYAIDSDSNPLEYAVDGDGNRLPSLPRQLPGEEF